MAIKIDAGSHVPGSDVKALVDDLVQTARMKLLNESGIDVSPALEDARAIAVAKYEQLKQQLGPHVKDLANKVKTDPRYAAGAGAVGGAGLMYMHKERQRRRDLEALGGKYSSSLDDVKNYAAQIYHDVQPTLQKGVDKAVDFGRSLPQRLQDPAQAALIGAGVGAGVGGLSAVHGGRGGVLGSMVRGGITGGLAGGGLSAGHKLLTTPTESKLPDTIQQVADVENALDPMTNQTTAPLTKRTGGAVGLAALTGLAHNAIQKATDNPLENIYNRAGGAADLSASLARAAKATPDAGAKAMLSRLSEEVRDSSFAEDLVEAVDSNNATKLDMLLEMAGGGKVDEFMQMTPQGLRNAIQSARTGINTPMIIGLPGFGRVTNNTAADISNAISSATAEQPSLFRRGLNSVSRGINRAVPSLVRRGVNIGTLGKAGPVALLAPLAAAGYESGLFGKATDAIGLTGEDQPERIKQLADQLGGSGTKLTPEQIETLNRILGK